MEENNGQWNNLDGVTGGCDSKKTAFNNLSIEEQNEIQADRADFMLECQGGVPLDDGNGEGYSNYQSPDERGTKPGVYEQGSTDSSDPVVYEYE